MVNRVDGNNYYTYTNQKKIDVPDTDEKFSLGYQKNESPPDAKEKEEISEQEKQQAAEKIGVRLELSTDARDAGAGRSNWTEEESAKDQSASGQGSLLASIKTYVMAAITVVRDFFQKIWNDQPPEDVSAIQLSEEELSDDLPPEDAVADVPAWDEVLQGYAETTDAAETADDSSESATEEERRNQEIQQSLRDGDLERVVKILTDNGRKTAARNSSLLTSYDKNGRVVEPSASVRERVLHGDRNTWEL